MRFVSIAACALLISQAAAQDVSGARIRAHVKFLASDLLEGRGVGQRGGELATEYLASQLAIAGARPANNGSFFQTVPLVSVRTSSDSRLSASKGDQRISFRWLDEFVGQSPAQTERETFDAEAIFVGHGITAPEFGWDDYAGADVTGKTVVLFTNEPPSTDAKFFDGRALTYYGRWSYKYEQALRKGAAAVLILHTTATAGYGWEVVRNSWGREEAHVKRSGAALSFAGWLTSDAATAFLALAGHTPEDLLARANRRGFRAIPLGLRVKGEIGSRVREVAARNVAGVIEGSDPILRNHAVIFSAHWDHLGKTEGSGDTIFNGAVDNASGCAMLLDMARAWAALPKKPRRSALFLFTAAEESGLLGSASYVQQPLVPLDKTALVLNFDSYYPFGRVKEVLLERADRTTFWPQIQNTAERFQFTVGQPPNPESGSFFRSDHFSFAKAGVAAFSVSGGKTYAVNQDETSAKLAEYGTKHYHQPSDEYKDEWDFAGMEAIARFGVALGIEAANGDANVKWR